MIDRPLVSRETIEDALRGNIPNIHVSKPHTQTDRETEKQLTSTERRRKGEPS